MEGHPALIYALFTIIGFLTGIGTAHLTILRKVNAMRVDITGVTKDVEANHNDIARADRRIDDATDIHKETLGLVARIAEQNNLLIQKIMIEK